MVVVQSFGPVMVVHVMVGQPVCLDTIMIMFCVWTLKT